MPRTYATQPKPVWISEAEACARLGYEARYFRRKVKSGLLPVNFSTVRGRKFLYNLNDIINVQTQYSTCS